MKTIDELKCLGVRKGWRILERATQRSLRGLSLPLWEDRDLGHLSMRCPFDDDVEYKRWLTAREIVGPVAACLVDLRGNYYVPLWLDDKRYYVALADLTPADVPPMTTINPIRRIVY